MNGETLKRVVQKWANKVGKNEAIMRLIDPRGPDLSVSVATKMVAGKYSPEPSFEKGQAILKEIAKDGFTLKDEEVA